MFTPYGTKLSKILEENNKNNYDLPKCSSANSWRQNHNRGYFKLQNTKFKGE